MSKVIFKKGLFANLPSSADLNVLLFATDVGRLFQGNGTGKDLTEYSDLNTKYANLVELKNADPRVENKLYITGDDNIYIYKNGGYSLFNGHNHKNFDVLSKLSEGENGKLLYAGKLIEDGGSGSVSMNQVTKLGVVAPKVVDIEIPYTAQFNLPSVEVLKFTAGVENQVITLVEFDNGDATDFEPNEFVKFDGTMSIRTEYSYDMTKDENIDEGFLSIVEFDKSKFKEVASLDVSEKIVEQTMSDKILDIIRNR